MLRNDCANNTNTSFVPGRFITGLLVPGYFVNRQMVDGGSPHDRAYGVNMVRSRRRSVDLSRRAQGAKTARGEALAAACDLDGRSLRDRQHSRSGRGGRS